MPTRSESTGGRIITKGDFEELGGTDVIEGIKEEGYTIGEIIRWDNAVKDYWRKDERFVISWRTAGVGGSYYL